MIWRARFSFGLVASVVVSVGSTDCKSHVDNHEQVASAQAPVASASAVAEAPKPKPWFSGAFQGSYDAKLSPVEVKTGAVREWAADDGKLSSGPGKLELTIADDGTVDGSGDGSLGASHASGKVEDDTLRVTLAPSDSSGLHGVLVATRDGDGFRGSIEASSSDSLKVRQAAVELKKQAN
jgi:hypothetical protein